MESNQPPNSGGNPSDMDEPQMIDLNKPCKISDVSFKGVRRTRSSLLAKIVSDLFPAKTLIDCLERAVQVKENLVKLNAFSNIELQIDQPDESDDENYRVTYIVEERRRIGASAKTSIDNHSTHLNFELGAPNIMGLGDRVNLSAKFNKRIYSSECRYTIPLTPWRSLWAPVYSLCYSQYEWEGEPSGYDQRDKAIINQVDFFTHPQAKHSISFENVWRYIKSSSFATPIEIREQCGHSVKSSLKHTLTWDSRVGGNFPCEGILARLSNEFATNLVKGGVKFHRQEANLQFNKSILPNYDLLCQLNLLAGTLLRPTKTSICDGFFAGGPMTLRGFKFQGLEPNIRGHPLGAPSYLSAGIHLYSILPFTSPDSPINEFVRPHVFFNAGTLGDLNQLWRVNSRNDLRRESIKFRDSLRYSCGFGLVMYFLSLRLEVNYCVPLKFKGGDLCSMGPQWGFGMTYS